MNLEKAFRDMDFILSHNNSDSSFEKTKAIIGFCERDFLMAMTLLIIDMLIGFTVPID